MVLEYLKYGLIAEKNPKESWIWISGNTFEQRELLRKMNGIWVAHKKKWRLPGSTDLASLKLSKAAAKRLEEMKNQEDLDWFENQDDRNWRYWNFTEFNR